MPQTIVLELPNELVERYQRAAMIAHKKLEDFMVDRLAETPLPPADDLPISLNESLKALETLDDETLWDIARSQLEPERQQLYDKLCLENSQGELDAEDVKRLNSIGEEARHLTLKKAHAYMLLKWRGHAIPSIEALQEGQAHFS